MDNLPYNQKNLVISLSQLQDILGPQITVTNIDVYRGAFVHRSYCTRKNENVHNGNVMRPANCLPLQEESNERLEFLGDAVLSLAVAHYLFDRFPDANEGFLTKMRTKLVNGVMLANLSELVGLSKYVIISQQIEDADGRKTKNILEDCFEALIGAIHVDAGYQVARDWIIRQIESEIDFSDLILGHENAKDVMIKHYQRVHGWVPKIFEMNRIGGLYQVCAKDSDDRVLAKGKGETKKMAELDCARNLMVLS